MKQIGALGGNAYPDNASSLRAGLIEAGTALEFVRSPAALWSLDRLSCFLNDDARELLGYCEHDFKQDAALWLERIHPEDRKEFLRAWKSLQTGDTRVSSRYRFQPKNRTQVLWLREVSFLYGSSGAEKPNVWTIYLEEVASESLFRGAGHVRNFVRGLTHEMGNNLQAIRGELDILRFSQAIPNDSAETIYRGINQVRRLVHEIEEYLVPSSVEPKTEDPASVLAEVIQSREKERPHPATFPPRVPEYCLRLHGVARVKTALDPFLGLGSSAVAAAQLGVDFIGIEMDEHYLKEAIARTKAALASECLGKAARPRRTQKSPDAYAPGLFEEP